MAIKNPTLSFNGSAATAQQVYDAFMSGIVRIDTGDGNVETLSRIYWENSDGTQTNPAAVSYVKLYGATGNQIIAIGTQHTADVG